MSKSHHPKNLYLRTLIGKKTSKKYPDRFRFSISFILRGTSTTSETYVVTTTHETFMSWLGKVLTEAMTKMKYPPTRFSVANGVWLDEHLHETTCEKMSPEFSLFIFEQLQRLQPS